jgi:hypothetical protein
MHRGHVPGWRKDRHNDGVDDSRAGKASERLADRLRESLGKAGVIAVVMERA